jgi:hypothetical protein
MNSNWVLLGRFAPDDVSKLFENHNTKWVAVPKISELVEFVSFASLANFIARNPSGPQDPFYFVACEESDKETILKLLTT